MDPIFLIDAIFQATRPIRSLPVFHGARWSAWLRFACKKLNLRLDEIAMGLLPLRNGQEPVARDEILALRLIVAPDGLARLPLLARALEETVVHGEFSSESLRLLFFKDALGCGVFAPDQSPHALRPLSPEALAPETATIQNLDSFTLRFFTPMRLKLPPGMKGSGIGIYCQPDFFAGSVALGHLLNKIRFLEPENFEPKDFTRDGIAIEEARLEWHDLRYNRQREIALGGVLGKIICQGRPSPMLARRLAIGQYLGAGKNPLFGLGFWRIPDLDKERQIPLEES